MKYTLLIVISLFLGSFLDETILAQESVKAEQTTIVDANIEGDGKREEIQRYFGYETLLFRYLTLPYDSSININQQGKFVDIGFLLITILPIVLLGLLYNRGKSFYVFAGLLTFYLLLCFSYSKIVTGNATYSIQDTSWKNLVNVDNKTLTDSLLEGVMNFSLFLTAPFRSLIEQFSTPNDFITYPTLIILALGCYYWIGYRKNQKTNTSIILLMFTSYGFLWLLLSGGITWYGFLMIPFALLSIGYWDRIIIDNPKVLRYLRGLLLSGIVLWTTMSIISRVSNIDIALRATPEHYGKTILNGSIFPYSVGVYNAKETLDNSSPNLTKALDKINSNNDFIYMIGTSYSFNIKNNTSRIFQDNLLVNYLQLAQNFKENDVIIDALKTSGFKYIIVDLHTPSLDRTPEKSLTKKFQFLLQSLYQNPDLGLIATDRIVEFTNANGQSQRAANVYGQKLITFGSYAIYEIL